MKKIGITEDGGVLLEMNAHEAHEFQKLGNAIEGKSDFSYHLREDSFSEVEFSGIFGAIRAWYSAQYRVNELRELVNDFELTMKGKEK